MAEVEKSIMARDFAKRFYHSPEWKHCQAEYVKQAQGLCENCMLHGIIRPGVIVHHKIHLTPANIEIPEITTCFDNLVLLCRDCHAKEHKLEKRYKVDELGRVITI